MRIEESLLTDLYQLTMLDAYRQQGMNGTAVFEMFFRKLPATRGFMVAAGLAQALDYLEHLRFGEDELEWLAGCGHFDRAFVDWLAGLRFTGDVFAMREGTICFPDEPLLRVEAPLPEAQFVESRLINIIHYQTLVATKAARTVLAAGDRMLVDFGMRRAHGGEAALWAARASYLAGFTGSATVVAGRRYGIPIFGTMAHSFVQAHESESEAFRNFAESRPEGVVLLIDTYDVAEGVRKVIELAPGLAARGVQIRAIRLDSGNLEQGARLIRQMLDDAGLEEIGIFLSGNLDEYQVADLCRTDAPVTGFGVGTRLDVSEDAPSLDIAYKLEAYEGRARRKRSAGKATWPGAKQVYREIGGDGRIARDVITCADDVLPGAPLVEPVMRDGERLDDSPDLDSLRRYTRAQLEMLPDATRRLEGAEPVPVEISPSLVALTEDVDAETRA